MDYFLEIIKIKIEELKEELENEYNIRDLDKIFFLKEIEEINNKDFLNNKESYNTIKELKNNIKKGG